MVEWSITTVLKTVVPRGTGGSNPLSPQEPSERNFRRLFLFPYLYISFIFIHYPRQEDFKCKIMLYYLVISKQTCNFAKK